MEPSALWMARDAIDDAGNHCGCDVREYTGGRGMAPDTGCVSLICDDPLRALLDVVDNLIATERDHEDLRGALKVLRGYRTDSLGKSRILYWPAIPVEMKVE